MKKLLIGGGTIAMAFLLSSCFVLQAFVIKKGALKPGDTTTIAMSVHPYSVTNTGFRKEYQFVLVGVSSSSDLVAGKAKWDVDGTFNGPQSMVVQAGLLAAIGTSCDVTGFTLTDLSANTWKGYTTQTPVSDKGLVGKTAEISVGLKAPNGATSGDTVQVVGVTGMWDDSTGDGVSGDDLFSCTGNGSAQVVIK